MKPYRNDAKNLRKCYNARTDPIDVGHILVGVILEEFLPGDRTAQAAQHAELAIVEIGDSGAVVLTLRLRVKVGNVGEENAG